ncbi:MAG: amylo-alpha-1,6-glucosidase [Prolixibacteraceae bacterium]|nr:amylo-alpha-1,6-glucosidase [Prolixibacteraceae bacterium]
MSYISFDSRQLTDIDFTSKREILRTNRAGAYISTALDGCNTRKYHGLFVIPITAFDGEKHMLLSQLDEIIVQNETEFNFGVRRFVNGYYNPKGNNYLQNFDYAKVPKFTFKAGNIVFTKERLLIENEQQILVKYTLEEASQPIKLRLRPFLAFRNIHSLSKANNYIHSEFEQTPNGIKICLYDGYPYLHMQLSCENRFAPISDWYYNVEYSEDKNRGYDYMEDLFTPGYFEVPLKKGESIIFSASVFEEKPHSFKQRFSKELNKRTVRDSFLSCLKNAALQFICHKGESEDIVAGYQWFNSKSRQTFIALPGLRLVQSDRQLGKKVIDSYVRYLNKGLFPDSIADKHLVYTNADTSLWFIWTIQQLRKQGLRIKEFYAKYGKMIREIVESYCEGTHTVNMLENGLLFSANQGHAATWMDSRSGGMPVVPRYGMPVELNALWFNAVCFVLEIAKASGDAEFFEKWRHLPERVEESFMKAYWDDDKGYLADVYNGFYTDWSVRPNMIIAAALDYSPLNAEQKASILSIVEKQLLTPRGLRSLSPADPAYIGVVEGNSDQREKAAHNGAAYPWLLQFYAEVYLQIHKKNGLQHIRELVDGFKSEMSIHCLGTISELYDGNPPYEAREAVSQAWNVAALLYCNHLITQAEKNG